MKTKGGRFFITAAVLAFAIISAAQAQADTTTTIPITDADWSAVGPGMGFYVEALAFDRSGNLYAGGEFTTAGGVPANYIAKWNGTSWSALGSGMGGTPTDVEALAVDGSGNLYAGGYFTSAGGVMANYIAKWNGTSWSALGAGMNWDVAALAVDNSGNIYAGGGFTTAGGVPIKSIAKWDGTSWSALGSGLGGTSPYVSALAFDGSGNLYVGGRFTTAGGVTVNNIAKWDGTSWSALGSGLGGTSPYVYALAVDGSGNLYAGGDFRTAGGVPVNYIAKWNGTTWSALGSQRIYAGVYALAVDGSGNLYAGGKFYNFGGPPVEGNYIAKWNGTSWSALGSGMNYWVVALAINGWGYLYAGGAFTNAGNKESSYIARCTIPCPAPDLNYPFGTGVIPRPTFSWQQAGTDAWYDVLVWSEARGGIAASMWVGPASCTEGTCSAKLSSALPAGKNWWWLNVWYGENACGFIEQPGGKWKLAEVVGCTAPPLTSPDNAVIAAGTKPTFIFSDTGAEWYNVLVWTSAGYLALNQWEDASAKCTAGTCTVVSNSTFPAGTTNWWWLNTYSASCGFQMQPGGLWKSFTQN